MGIPKIDSSDVPAVLADQLIVTEQQKSFNFARDLYQAPVALPAAALDTTVSSLANIMDMTGITNFDLSEGIMPAGWEGYQRNREAWQATSDIASLFFIAGASTKAIQSGSKLSKLAASKGVPDEMLAFALSNRAKAASIEKEFASQAMSNGTVIGKAGLEVPGLTDIATPWASLNGALKTADGARAVGLKMRTNAAIKETIASEVAIVTLMNDSEFLFGEDTSLLGYVLGGAFAGGVVSGIDRAIGAVGYRRALAQAAKSSTAVAAISRGTEITFGHKSNVLGLRWTGLAAGANEMNRAEALLDMARTGDHATANNEVLIAAGTRSRQTAERNVAADSQQMYKDNPVRGVSEAPVGKLADDRIDRVTEWTRKDQKNAIGIQSLEEPSVIGRYEKEVAHAHREVFKANKSGDIERINKARERLASLEEHHVGVIEADGVMNASRSRQTPWQEEVPTGKTTLKHDRRKGTFELQDKHAPAIAINKQGVLSRRVGKSSNPVLDMSKLSFTEATALFKQVALGIKDFSQRGFGREFLDNFDGNIDVLPYHMLDAVDQGLVDLSKIGPTNREALLRLETARETGEITKRAFMQKFTTFKESMAKGKESPYDIAKRLNMQMHDADGMQTELFQAMEMMRQGGAKNLGEYFELATFDDMVTAMAAIRGGKNQAEAVALGEKIKNQMRGGNMLSLHEQPTPVGFVRKILDGASDTDANFAKIAEAARVLRLVSMSQSQNPMIASMRDIMQQMPGVVEKLSDVGSLTRDGLIESSATGAKLSRLVTTTTNRFREIEAIQHAHVFGQAVKREADKMAEALIKPLAEAHNKLLKDKRSDILAQHSDYTSVFRVGAELESDYLVAGLNAMDKNSPRVRRMTQQLFGKTPEQLVGDAPLHVFDKAAALRGEYKALNFSDEAVQFMNGIMDASYQMLDMSNELARLMSRAETPRVRGHMPVADFSRLKMRYIADQNGRTVGYVTGKTVAEVEQLQQEAIEYAARHRKETLMPSSEGQVKEWVQTKDQHRFANLVDYGDPVMQGGTTKGRAADVTRDISGDVGVGQLIALREGVDSMRVKATYVMFEPIILKNRQLKEVGNAGNFGDRQMRNGERAYFNANEEWENVLFTNSGRPEGSLAYKVDNTFTTWLEDVFEEASYRYTGRQRVRTAEGKLSKQQLVAMDKIVGSGYEPMSAAAEAILRTKTKPSADDRKVAQFLQSANKVTGEVFLKFMNVAHPILNVLSIGVTTPAVAQQLVRRKNEDLQAWKQRIGPWADFIDGDSVATTSATKLMTNGIAFFHSDEGAQVLEEAAKNGFITANMLEELNSAIFKVPTKASAIGENLRKYADLINMPINAIAKKRGIELSADTVSERSETYVRGLMHAMGYQFAKAHKNPNMTDMELHSFAHWFANQNIADYAPNIRGQGFRGVSGIPLGLFQSFGVNYLQRVFKYVENADTRALAVQAATQTAIFGAEGLPGWPAVNEYFMASHDRGGEGKGTFNDRIYNAYGKQIGDVLLSGTVSNLPRLFGAGDGMNFYTSGDSNPRIMNFTPPAFALASQTMSMVSEGFKAEAENMKRMNVGGEWSSSRTAEVIASYMPNRGVRSMMELAMGYSVDRAGDLVTEDTRSGIAGLARALGTKTVDEVRMRQSLYDNRVDQQHRNARLAQVGRAFTAAVRAQAEELGETPEDFTVTKEYLDAFVARAVAVGGRKDTANGMFDRLVDKAYTPEAQREMKKYVGGDGVLKGGDVYQHLMERLLHHGFDVSKMPMNIGEQNGG